MQEINTLKCGQQVKFKVGSLNGIITAAIIRFDSVQYEVRVHDGNVMVMHEEEFFSIKGMETQKIGYGQRDM